MSAAYQLWHGQGTRSLRVLWLAEELGIAERFEVHHLPFPPRAKAPEYLDLNPLGSLPLFVDGAVRMTESIAICQYLLDRHAPTPLGVAPDEPGFADFLQFSLFGEATLMPPIGMMVRQLLLEAPERRSEAKLTEARENLAFKLRHVSDALADGRDYLAGGRMTLADIAVGYALGLIAVLGERAIFAPDVASYLGRLQARPAWARAAAR